MVTPRPLIIMSLLRRQSLLCPRHLIANPPPPRRRLNTAADPHRCPDDSCSDFDLPQEDDSPVAGVVRSRLHYLDLLWTWCGFVELLRTRCRIIVDVSYFLHVLQILPTAAFLFLFQEWLHDFPHFYYYFYTVSKKTRHLTFAHNFTKYWPIFKILSLLDSVGNL